MNFEFLVEHLEWGAANAKYYGYLIIFILMFLESSILPLPSEIIMIPAGFMASRSEFTFANPWLDLVVIIIAGTLGALLAAYFNYYLAKYVGRYFLYKYGKYFFIKPKTIRKAEKEFSKHGDFATLICRIIPTARQLISIPAGLAEMPLWRFTTFTAMGSFIWSAILSGLGFYLGYIMGNISYQKLIAKAETIIKTHTIWFIIIIMAIFIIYFLIRKTTKKNKLENLANGSLSKTNLYIKKNF